MNIQTERLENQTARFTVQIDPAQFEKAKQTAARKVAAKVRIPGFRKGKAPYSVLIQNGLESQIMIEALDALYPTIYRESLEQSGLESYWPGTVEKYDVDPPTLVHTVPLKPEVDLGDYLAIRADYNIKGVTDDEVNAEIEKLREQEALIEESSRPAVMGNRVTVTIHAEYADDPASDVADESTSSQEEDDSEANEKDIPAKGDIFIDTKDTQIRLQSEDSPVLPGFSEALVGANAGDTVIFSLTVPEDADEDAGRDIEFTVTVSKIETITLPELSDDFAMRVTEDEDSPLTLLELRMRVRENLEKEAENSAKATCGMEVLEQLVKGATIAYPEIMVEERIDDMIERIEARLKSQKIPMALYLKLTGHTEESLREHYRPEVIGNIEQTLVFGELVEHYNFEIGETDIQESIEKTLQGYGSRAEELREMFDRPEIRNDVANRLFNDRVLEFLVALGRGEELPAARIEQSPETAPVLGESDALVESHESQDDGESNLDGGDVADENTGDTA